jgi:hypothetical protein
MPEAIEHLRAVLAAHHGVGVAHANRIKVDQHGRLVQAGAIPIHGVYSALPNLLAQNTVYCPAIMCRREAVREAGPMPDYPYCQDWWLWLSIALCGWHFYGVAETLGYYRRHPGNTSRIENLAALHLDEIAMLRDLIDSAKLNSAMTAVARSTIKNRQRVLAWLDTERGNREEARKAFAQLAQTESLSLNTIMGLAAVTIPLTMYRWFQRTGVGGTRERSQVHASVLSEQEGST